MSQVSFVVSYSFIDDIVILTPSETTLPDPAVRVPETFDRSWRTGFVVNVDTGRIVY